MYDEFISGFCQVQFLCYEAEPNWLGWIVLTWGALFGAAILLGAVVSFLDS